MEYCGAMTTARAHLVDSENGGFYHCTSRCVRRGWLCGVDPVSGRSYAHRKAWIEGRLLELAEIFAIDVYGYAVMSNHYHVVVRVAPKRVLEWGDAEVAERWLRISGKDNTRARAGIIGDAQRVATLRKRLGNLSWYMSYVNEPMARRANREDGCKGRFWEGRFKSTALLDETAVVSCMVYVDLNPVRAGVCTRVEEAPHTSIRRRLKQPSATRLGALERVGVSLSDYVVLLRCTIHLEHATCTELSEESLHTLSRRHHSGESWLREVRAHRAKYRAYGAPERLRAYAHTLGQQWIRTAFGQAFAA